MPGTGETAAIIAKARSHQSKKRVHAHRQASCAFIRSTGPAADRFFLPPPVPLISAVMGNGPKVSR